MIPEKMIQIAKKKGLNGIAITDHNMIKGGLQAKKRNNDKNFHVIVGSEIRTETCEIIGLFLNEEISSQNPFAVIDEIKDQGGITVLAHPFRSFQSSRKSTQKKNLTEILEKIDFVEAVNSRVREKDNRKAFILASKMGKPKVAGSDAHFYQEIGRTKMLISGFEGEEELRKNLLEKPTHIIYNTTFFPKTVAFLFLSALCGRIRKLAT